MGRAGQVNLATATFTPAASSHATPAVVGGAQEFKGMTTGTGGGVQIISASLLINNATIETTAWRVYLYNVTPPSAIADAATFDLPAGDQASFLGYVDIAQVVDLGSSLYVQSDNLNKAIRPAGGRSVFGYLVNQTTLTPGAVAHIVTLYTIE
jgi:hypothetical protein